MAAEAVFSTILQESLSKLSSLVQNEIGLLWGLEDDKKKLESNLSATRAVLHDAEMRQVNEMAVRDWLGKLKDAAYDAEDLVDEFIIEARRRKVVNQRGMRKKVRNFCSLSNPLAFRLKMAHKMQELRKRFDGIAKEKNDFHFKVEVVESRPPISRTRETCSYVIESEVCGRKNEAEKLIESLINSENEEVLSVIPIVGMGGLGKTTLAQLIFNHESVGTHFDLKMWVYVSEDFDVGRLLKEILQSAIEREAGNLSIELLHARLRKTLNGKKYLLVLDDVWNEEVNEWSKLKTWLKCGGMGSKILPTTRSDKVAAIMGTLPAHKLGKLSEKDSWTLFETLARPHPNFVSIGKEMVGKCGGLPLAIRTLGGLMYSKTTQSQWESVRNSEFWNPQDYDGGVLPALRLSYDHLTPSLKQCFAYCARIPKGSKFRKDDLIWQWIAQGFIHSDGENDLLEEQGEGYFNELLQRSLFHVEVKEFSWEKAGYNMHDLIHDLLRFIVGAEYSIVEASMKIEPSEIRHLSLQDWNEQRELKILEALKTCKKLRTVSLTRYSFDHVNVLSSLRCLRVLDLSSSVIMYMPNSIDKLKHLRYLDISYTLIKELPESICNLHSLQTFKLQKTKIKNLPKNMKKMISLRHVEFNPHQASPAPKGIGELTCLRTWTNFVVSKDNGAEIEELKGLNQLSGYIHIEGLDNLRNGLCAREANLKAKQYLSALELSWSDAEDSKEVMENLEPHPNLKKLIVNNYNGLNFPGWMMTLTNLVDIKLSDCDCEHLPHLWQLPLLESLDINGMFGLKYIVEFDGDHNCKDVFPSLKRLHLSWMPELEEWSSQATNGGRQGNERDQQVILKSLCHLCIRRCPKLIQLPWLRLLPSIEYLEIRGVGLEAIEMPTSPSLIELVVDDMPNLERWSPQEADGDEGNQVIFHSLGTLKINECPKLVCLPGVLLSAPREADHEQVTFPQLKELQVKKCPRIVRFPHLLPSIKILSVAATNQMLLGWVANTSLTELFIEGFPEVECLPEALGPNHGVLHTFEIRDCPKLMSVSYQLENLHALKTLVIAGCSDLVLSLPDGGLQHHQQQQSPPLNFLEKLEISNSCEKQISLPGDLTGLYIDDCPKVFSSPLSLKNLTQLTISRCPDMMNLLQHAESLTSLTRLEFWTCPGMSSLPESIGDLNSLRSLVIIQCPEITTLPEGLQRLTNIVYLQIFDCPVLKRRLRCNEGQDWHKVAHVPEIEIDFEDPRDSLSSVGHPSLMHSSKMGCNIINMKKLLLPSCCSSSPPYSSTSSSI